MSGCSWGQRRTADSPGLAGFPTPLTIHPGVCPPRRPDGAASRPRPGSAANSGLRSSLNFTRRGELVAGHGRKSWVRRCRCPRTPGQAERPDYRHRPADLLRPDPVRVRGRPLPQQHSARPDAGPDSGGQVKAIAPTESAQAPIIYPLAPLGCSPRCDRGAVARSDAVSRGGPSHWCVPRTGSAPPLLPLRRGKSFVPR